MLSLRRAMLAAKCRDLYDFKERLRVDGTYVYIIISDTYVAYLIYATYMRCIDTRYESVDTDKCQRALFDRFGYSSEATKKAPHNQSKALNANECTRRGNYLQWKIFLHNERFEAVKSQKEKDDIEAMIQESLRKAQAAGTS